MRPVDYPLALWPELRAAPREQVVQIDLDVPVDLAPHFLSLQFAVAHHINEQFCYNLGCLLLASRCGILGFLMDEENV